MDVASLLGPGYLQRSLIRSSTTPLAISHLLLAHAGQGGQLHAVGPREDRKNPHGDAPDTPALDTSNIA